MRYVIASPPDRVISVRGLLQVAPRVLYKQVAMLLPNARQLRTLRLRAVVTATASELEEGSSLLAV